MNRPQLGEWRTVNGHISKRSKHGRVSWFEVPGCKPQRMMFIGWRTRHEGLIDREWDDYGSGFISTFEHKRSFEAWLFVSDARRKPVCVLPSQVATTPPADDESEDDSGE